MAQGDDSRLLGRRGLEAGSQFHVIDSEDLRHSVSSGSCCGGLSSGGRRVLPLPGHLNGKRRKKTLKEEIRCLELSLRLRSPFGRNCGDGVGRSNPI